jgi:hypothetical protein
VFSVLLGLERALLTAKSAILKAARAQSVSFKVFLTSSNSLCCSDIRFVTALFWERLAGGPEVSCT